ncbi:MAG: hypothetical protein KAJ19_10255, partial [Gammaproteobacteria bacterium]|nr:hypothetical protein [Gammaproteobacteria bacterium]
ATVDLVTADNIPLPITPASSVLIQIGDEIMSYVVITTGAPPQLTGLTRGLNGTRAEFHASGSEVKVLSGRPDGLYSDQITGTDILDLRHLVNPNGFDYDSLLKTNLDRLMRGQLRANWKRSGSGPQGPFVSYQDSFSSGGGSIGITQLDSPDNIRMIFSDAAQVQKVEAIVTPATAEVDPNPPQPAQVAFDLGVAADVTDQAAANIWSGGVGDAITFPVAQLKSGLQAPDQDQVRWLNDGVLGAVQIRVDGTTSPIDPSLYTVTPANPTSVDDLVITFNAGFPTITNPEQLYITLAVMYGAGRGLSRRADSLHSISYLGPSADLLVSPSGNPSSNQSSHVAWELLWSKYRSSIYKGLVPSTSEMYADLGSKSVVISPFRRAAWASDFRTIDGTAANIGAQADNGVNGSVVGTSVFTDSVGPDFTTNVTAGMALVIPSGPAAGRYTILSVDDADNLTVEVPGFNVSDTSITYTIHAAQGLMPVLASDGVTAKWGATDPLGLFSSTGDTGNPFSQDIYVTLPRHLVPGWGEVNVPIQATSG